MAEHNDLGRLGEQLARDFLIAKGYQILEQNWSCGHKEIDIIAMDGKELVIVEVKTRRVQCLVDPEETVDKIKQRTPINYSQPNKSYLCVFRNR